MNEEPGTQQTSPPLVKDAVRTISQVRTWFDYKSFSRQRGDLLRDPVLAVTGPPNAEAGWKPPLSFALQGFVLTTFIIQLTASGFGLILSRPRPYTERIKSTVQQNLEKLNEDDETLKLNLSTVEGADEGASFEWVFDLHTKPVRTGFGGVLRTDYVNALKSAISETDGLLARAQAQSNQIATALDLANRAEQLSSKLFGVLLPFTLVLAAYVFRLLLRKRAAQGVARTHSHVAYLYLTTAYLFWMNVALAIAQAILHNAFVYSGFYDREMFESAGDLATTQLLFLQGEIIVPFLLCLPLIIISFRRVAKAIRTVLDLPLSTSGLIASYIRVSNFVSFLVLSFVIVWSSWGYARVSRAWEGHKISLERSQALR